MKKNVKAMAMALAAALILGGAFILGCDDGDDNDDEWISYAEISAEAKSAIEVSFGTELISSSTIKSVKKDSDSYEIYLNDGTKIDFYLTGQWKEIDRDAGIADTYFEKDAELEKIKAWADINHPRKTIEEVDRESARAGFEIDFLNAEQDVFVASTALQDIGS